MISFVLLADAIRLQNGEKIDWKRRRAGQRWRAGEREKEKWSILNTSRTEPKSFTIAQRKWFAWRRSQRRHILWYVGSDRGTAREPISLAVTASHFVPMGFGSVRLLGAKWRAVFSVPGTFCVKLLVAKSGRELPQNPFPIPTISYVCVTRIAMQSMCLCIINVPNTFK